jgi:imidazolonepropionase-like amidohydrolase
LEVQFLVRATVFRERGLKQFIESGAVLGLGTDSGTPLDFHTEALWREMKTHPNTGMSPHRAIFAAPRINAGILGKADERGTTDPRTLADNIVLRGTLFGIQALADVRL